MEIHDQIHNSKENRFHCGDFVSINLAGELQIAKLHPATIPFSTQKCSWCIFELFELEEKSQNQCYLLKNLKTRVIENPSCLVNNLHVLQQDGNLYLNPYYYTSFGK